MNNCAHSIHVCYSLYDANGTYSKFMGTSMLSLLENTSSCVTIHILHDNTLTKANRDKFIELVNSYGQKLQFHSIALDDSEIERFKLTQFSPGSLYRLLICDALPVEIERAIYLDADTVVHIDIKELWEEDLEGAEIGACIDIGHIELCKNQPIPPFYTAYNVDYERCLNSGILLLDLKKLRANFPNFFADCVGWLRQPRDFPVYDGEVINFFFNKTYKALPYKYNTSVHYEMTLGNPIVPSIYHYVTTFTLGIFDNPYNRLFWSYFSKTPWCDGGFILRVFNLIPKLAIYNTENMRRVMFILNNARQRKFVVENGSIRNQVQNFFRKTKIMYTKCLTPP